MPNSLLHILDSFSKSKFLIRLIRATKKFFSGLAVSLHIMDFELNAVVGEGESDDLWGWMAAHQMNFAPEHPSHFISDKFEIAKIPFLPTPPQGSEKASTTILEKALKVDPGIVQESPPAKGAKAQSTSSKSSKPPLPDYNTIIQSSIITSTATSSAEEKWITLETPKNLIQKKQFNEKCLDMLTDVSAFAHHDPPMDLVAETVKGRKNGAFKYIEGDPSHPKESWKRDGFSWNQKGGWHVIYENKLKRKTFTLQGDKSFKKSVTKQAMNVPHHDAIVVTYFYHPSENEDKKKRKKEESSEDLPPAKKTPPSNAPFPPTVLQVCSCTHHNPQEEIIEQEKMLRHLIFGSLTENTILSFEDFVSALVKNVTALPGLMKSRNPNSYDIPTKTQKSSSFTKEEAKSLLPKVLGKTVNCIDFQRFFFMFGPCNALLSKLKDVYNFFHQRKDLAEKQVNGKDKSRAIYPAPEPMCLVLTVYCPSEKRTKNYLLKNGDYGLQFQVSRSLWSICYSNLSELLNSNPSLF